MDDDRSWFGITDDAGHYEITVPPGVEVWVEANADPRGRGVGLAPYFLGGVQDPRRRTESTTLQTGTGTTLDIQLPREQVSAAIGELLKAAPGVAPAASPAFAFQWFLDGDPVPTADEQTFRVRPQHLGRRLTVRVEVPGDPASSVTSPVVRVGKVSPTIAAPNRRIIREGARPHLPVVVRTRGITLSTGTVTLVNGGKVVDRARLTRADDGRAVVRLPLLRRGVHRLDVVYSGDRYVERLRSLLTVVVRGRR